MPSPDHPSLPLRMQTGADWGPLLLVASLLLGLWLLMFERVADDGRLLSESSRLAHANVAFAVARSIGQDLAQLSHAGEQLYGQSCPRACGRLHELMNINPAWLGFLIFDARGQLQHAIGGKAEPRLLDAARDFAARVPPGEGDLLWAGKIPEKVFPPQWQLPLFYWPARGDRRTPVFVAALYDLEKLQKRFDGFGLGRSGEIVLVDDQGRELLRLYDGILDSPRDIGDTRRFAAAFARPAGTLEEQVGPHKRLYAHRRIDDMPLAVLVSRTEYDIMLPADSRKRSYWTTALFATLVGAGAVWFWFSTARHRARLLRQLTSALEENNRLIAQIETEKQTALKLANHDKLTGLANRMLFNEIAARYLIRSRRIRSRFAILFVDLDRFKPINDNHGHKVGDQLLIEVARRLRECVRQSDLVARLGGDEFVVLIADLRGTRDAEAIATKILARLSEPYSGIVATTDLSVTPSIGIAMYPDDGTEIETLLRQADSAMYRAKECGRATFYFADPALNRKWELEAQIEADLPAALRHGEIYFHYQPKISLEDFRISGLEALARWHHPELGPVSPADFIAIAEKSRNIIALGDYVIERVCAQLAAWRDAGVPLVPVAVNVSPAQLRSPHLLSTLSLALARHGLPSHCLQIEVTETGLINGEETDLITTLEHIDRLGIHIAIDDFGTGFSGLSRLRRLPARTVKIDRSFIKDIRNDLRDAPIVSSTISLAHNLRLKVVAEGIELPEQLVYLRTHGCDEAQGYFFSPPLSPEDIRPLLEAGRCPTDFSGQLDLLQS